MLSDDQIIGVYKALSDPNRLRLYQLLLASDRTNSELMNETRLSQNLLSHHLTVLTDSGLVNMRRSIGDARRHYYSPALDLPYQLNAWWQQYCPFGSQTPGRLERRRRVLFLCRRNAARSLIAEAMASQLFPEALEAHSAGMETTEDLDPVAIQVLAEHDIPTDFLAAKTYHTLLDVSFDYVITVCDVVHENHIPTELERAQHVHWSLSPPEEESDNREVQVGIARQLIGEVRQRLVHFVHHLAMDEHSARHT
jgi:protein-tyrosine-phosphatase